MSYRKIAAAALTALLWSSSAAMAAGDRVKITGEVIDTWCYLTEIMFAEGSAHHQCAVWCAAGGIPVGILGEDKQVYLVLKMGEEDSNVANPTVLKIQTHKVQVDGILHKRDGMNYLLVDQVLTDEGVVTANHEDYGIQPFGE